MSILTQGALCAACVTENKIVLFSSLLPLYLGKVLNYPNSKQLIISRITHCSHFTHFITPSVCIHDRRWILPLRSSATYSSTSPSATPQAVREDTPRCWWGLAAFTTALFLGPQNCFNFLCSQLFTVWYSIFFCKFFFLKLINFLLIEKVNPINLIGFYWHGTK